MKNILIIGGCGYIGSHLFKYLRKKRYAVSTVDLEWFGNYVNPANIKIDYSKLTKKNLLKYDVVILLAGHSNYYMSRRNPAESLKNNVLKFVDLLEKLSDQKFIYASSSSVYQELDTKDAIETSKPAAPIDHYSLSKLEIDYYAMLSKANYFGLRFGTVNGASPNLRTDLMLHRMYGQWKKNKTITIHNPQIYRAILGINDLCRAVDAIIQNDKAAPGIYNLASFNMKINDLAKRTAKALGNTKIIVNPKFTHYKSFILNTKKFEKALNFRFTDTVETILASIKKTYEKSHKSERL